MKEYKLVNADYSACVRCINLGIGGRKERIDYCKLDYPNIPEMEVTTDQILQFRKFLLGCGQFGWNGMPVNDEAYKIIQSDAKYAESPLRTLKADGLVSHLTYWQIMCPDEDWAHWNREGSEFDVEKFQNLKK